MLWILGDFVKAVKEFIRMIRDKEREGGTGREQLAHFVQDFRNALAEAGYDDDMWMGRWNRQPKPKKKK